jgi:hypothetical protein
MLTLTQTLAVAAERLEAQGSRAERQVAVSLRDLSQLAASHPDIGQVPAPVLLAGFMQLNRRLGPRAPFKLQIVLDELLELVPESRRVRPAAVRQLWQRVILALCAEARQAPNLARRRKLLIYATTWRKGLHILTGQTDRPRRLSYPPGPSGPARPPGSPGPGNRPEYHTTPSSAPL